MKLSLDPFRFWQNLNCATIQYHPISAKDKGEAPVNSGKKVLPSIFLRDMRCMREEAGRETYSLPTQSNHKKISPQKSLCDTNQISRSSRRDRRKIQKFAHLIKFRQGPEKVEGNGGVHPGEEKDKSDVAEQQQDAMEAKNDIWSISCIDIMSKSENLCVPQESSFPVPLKYFDAVRRTSPTLDVWQERQVGDSWNLSMVTGNLSPMDWLHAIQDLEPQPHSQGYMWSGEGLTKIQATSRPEYVWAEVWSSMSNKEFSAKKEKNHWAKEKTEVRQCQNTERNLLHFIRKSWTHEEKLESHMNQQCHASRKEALEEQLETVEGVSKRATM